MVLPEFRYHRPDGLKPAIALLDELGASAMVYAGGTELLLVLREGLLDASDIVDVKYIDELHGIGVEQETLSIGAATTHTALVESAVIQEHLPALARLEAAVANRRVRNSGTLGGNLCFGEPHGDPPSLLLALDARAELHGTGGLRTCGLDDFLIGPFETSLSQAELLTRVLVPIRAQRGSAYQQVRILERPSVGVASVIEAAGDGSMITSARVVVGCVGPRPALIAEASAVLVDRPISEITTLAEEAARAAMAVADVTGDAYGPEPYKRHLVRVLTYRTLVEAADEARHASTPAVTEEVSDE